MTKVKKGHVWCLLHAEQYFCGPFQEHQNMGSHIFLVQDTYSPELAVHLFWQRTFSYEFFQPNPSNSQHSLHPTNKHKQTNKNAHWTWNIEEYWGKSTSQAQTSPLSELHHYGLIQTCSSWARLRFNRACPRLILLSTSAIMFWRYLRNSSSYLTFLNRGLSWYLVRLKGKRRSLHMYTICELMWPFQGTNC